MAVRRTVDHSALELFSDELRRARTRAGLSQEQLGELINYSGSLVGMIETGKRPPSLDFVQRCDSALRTEGLLERLYPLVAREVYESWFRPWVDLEATAVMLRSWQLVLVPGLLQTENYARAVFRAAQPGEPEDRIDEFTTARLERQHILHRPDPPFLWAVMDEAVLHRPVGGSKVMRDQLAHLLDMAANPRLKVLVVPHDLGANAGLTGAFTIASFNDAPDIVYLETAAEGQISDNPGTVRSCALAFDMLRAEALPRSRPWT